ncbi:putative dehydrogenase [Cytobacillus oceanisediminis]|uniref:Putative dehydrogenase n=1 Tax=Cytobacillus oceanisediminis TaxID=665099 RepID=A0A2V2ZW20_9BACI|nr:Gfo/Idh/MocA family oxidoreductase [Cytobacillus oceanisediminis]PWW28245.1 putative dehydrogenase [Cytobacillus oceanisediminis]
MNKQLTIGMIGLDTSHCPAFTELLNNKNNPHHVKGGYVKAAFPGGSEDFELSYSRVGSILEQLQSQYNVHIAETPQEVGELSDAILLTSVDGRVHLEQFKQVVSYKKPIFIDKPFAVSSKDATEIYRLAAQAGIAVMSSSSLRYVEDLQAEAKESPGAILGADTHGPMKIEPTQPGLFWYGIHSVEMLYTILGKGCKYVTAVTNENYDLITGEWEDGRIGTVRGNRKGNNTFGALIHRESSTIYVDGQKGTKPHYASLLENIIKMFQTSEAQIDLEETIEIMRFIEAANESRITGERVWL